MGRANRSQRQQGEISCGYPLLGFLFLHVDWGKLNEMCHVMSTFLRLYTYAVEKLFYIHLPVHEKMSEQVISGIQIVNP